MKSSRDHRTRVGRERSARTEQRILEAALGVFAERGPDAPVIDEFVQAAGIARGTFYNHFKTVEDLLEATSEWTTKTTLDAIEHAMAPLEGAPLRLGVGIRLFCRRGEQDRLWSRFVARIGKIGGLDNASRDIDAGIRSGQFRAPSREAARDIVFGGVFYALRRIGEDDAPAGFGDHIAEVCLHALRVDPRRIAAAVAHELPALAASPKD